MKKVLIVDNSLDTTGAFNAITSSCNDLKDYAYFTFVIPNRSRNHVILKELGYKCYKLDFVELSRRPFDLVRYFPKLILNGYRLSKLIKSQKIDIVHINDIYNLVGISAKLFKKFKLITHIRRMPDSFPIRIYKFWVFLHSRFSDYLVPVSNANKKIFEACHNLTVIYDNLPEKEQYEEYFPKNNEIIKVLYLANYNLGKGQNYAIEAFKEFKLKNPHVKIKLELVGGDFGIKKNNRYKSLLVDIVNRYKLCDSVAFKDKTDDVEKNMKEFDIILNFSDSESFSRVNLEALYYGIPLIATDVGGTAEMFENNKSGLLVEKGDIKQMSTALENLVHNFDFRVTISKNSKVYVREKFNINKTSLELKKVYHGF